MNYHRTPPHSVEAEMSAIGSLCLSPQAAAQVASTLEPEDFYRPAHRTVYDACLRLMAKRMEIDLVTLPHELGSALEDCGGMAYLIQILEAVPSAHNAQYYADIVKDLSALRRLQSAAQEVIQGIDDDREPGDKVAEAQGLFANVRTGRRPWKDASDIALTMSNEPPVALSTCWPSFNETTSFGGLTRGEPHVIGGETGKGKTLLAIQLARHFVDSGLSVAFVTLELTSEFLLRRWLFQETGYWSTSHAERDGEAAAYEAKVRGLNLVDLYLFEYSSSVRRADRTTDAVIANLRAFHAVKKPDVVFIDYVQILASPGRIPLYEHHNNSAMELKHFAKQCDVCLIELSQIKMKDGVLENRGGKEYEDAAATVLHVVQSKEDGVALMSKKSRHGEETKLPLVFDPKRLTFNEVNDPYANDPTTVWRGAND